MYYRPKKASAAFNQLVDKSSKTATLSFMRVRILKDHKFFKKGSIVLMNDIRARQLIELGVAVISKDMDAYDMRTK